MKDEQVMLCAYWRERRITAREYVKLCYEFLGRLQDFSTAFERRCVGVGKMPKVVPMMVPKDYSGFERVVLKAVPDPQDSYTNPASTSKDFTLDSTFNLGFRVSFSDAGDGTVPPTRLVVSIKAGAFGGPHSPTNVVTIKIPTEYREFWQNNQRAKDLMSVVISTWQPAFAALTSSELRQALDPKQNNDFTVGPISYFGEKGVAAAVEGTAAIQPITSNGVFLSISAAYPWAASVDRFKPCYARLNSAGLLQWPHRRQATA